MVVELAPKNKKGLIEVMFLPLEFENVYICLPNSYLTMITGSLQLEV
jgi:hypothetical protein